MGKKIRFFQRRTRRKFENLFNFLLTVSINCIFPELSALRFLTIPFFPKWQCLRPLSGSTCLLLHIVLWSRQWDKSGKFWFSLFLKFTSEKHTVRILDQCLNQNVSTSQQIIHWRPIQFVPRIKILIVQKFKVLF